MIRVVNKRSHTESPSDIYIGRGTPLGNPYTSKPLSKTKAKFACNTREESVGKYREWLNENVKNKNKDVTDALNNIWKKAKEGDVNLVCFCSPKLCHGDVIKEIIEKKL